MDELGYLYIYGRIASAQRWKVGSDVVYSAGIETVLRSHPKISACMVCSSMSWLPEKPSLDKCFSDKERTRNKNPHIAYYIITLWSTFIAYTSPIHV